MKRKRGPAPKGKKGKIQKKKDEDEELIAPGVDGGENAVDDESEFDGFSSDDDAAPESFSAVGVDTAAQSNGEPQTKKKRGKQAPPSQEELMEMFFRSASFQSNLFKLQVDELLSEVRVKYEKMDRVERILHQLRDALLQLADTEEQLVVQSLYGVNVSYIPSRPQ